MFANSWGVNNLTMTHDWFQATDMTSLNAELGRVETTQLTSWYRSGAAPPQQVSPPAHVRERFSRDTCQDENAVGMLKFITLPNHSLDRPNLHS